MKYFLAIDIGASSGRHLLGSVENGVLKIEEVYRFPNEMKKLDGQLVWDTAELFREILAGMKKCKEIGKIPVSVGIDTWGVDFVLLDEQMKMIGPAVAYRDNRTEGMHEKVAKLISDQEHYTRTGIPMLIFNTIYQLMAVESDILKKTHMLLFMPDYLHYLLSGVAKTEYTIATTSALIGAASKEWDDEVIAICGFPREIFSDLTPPGTILGNLTSEVQNKIGYNCKVIMPASHDTKSAIMAVPADSDNPLFLSSGTWSIMGVTREKLNCSEESRKSTFTNEGGYGGQICYMRNIMGLWIIQCVKKEYGDKYTFGQLCELAEKSTISSIIDVNDPRFLAPESMINTLQEICAENSLVIPKEPGDIAAVIYNSLAMSYHNTAKELESLTGETYDAIYIVGGGAKAEYLNKLTTKYTGKTVHAGPSEATAIGNMIAQMIELGVFNDLREARDCVKRSRL